MSGFFRPRNDVPQDLPWPKDAFVSRVGRSNGSRATTPYAGRSPEFDAALRRAEEASVAKPTDTSPEYVGKTRHTGQVQRADGSFVSVGPYFDREVLDSLPYLDLD